MEFGTAQELDEYLGSIQGNYRGRGYAAGLWASGIQSVEELADSSVETLVAAGITNRFAASNIKARAAAAGAAAAGAAGAAAGASARGQCDPIGEDIAIFWDLVGRQFQRLLARLNQGRREGHLKAKAS